MTATPAETARAYFDALGAHDLDAAVAVWRPGAVDRIVGDRELVAPHGIRAYFGSLFAAFPDFAIAISDLTAEGDRVAVRWHATGTFAGPGELNGFAPNHERIAIDGCDVLTVTDGLIAGNDVFSDSADVARQLGLLPANGSPAQQRLAQLASLGILARRARPFFERALPAWDGGAVQIAGTVAEGDEVAGFRVLELPGHAPGLIGLYRESDRLALVSDTVYTLDVQTGRKGPPRLPHPAFDEDVDRARESIRRLAELGPRLVWAGHADPVAGDVADQLRAAADAPSP